MAAVRTVAETEVKGIVHSCFAFYGITLYLSQEVGHEIISELGRNREKIQSAHGKVNTYSSLFVLYYFGLLSAMSDIYYYICVDVDVCLLPICRIYLGSCRRVSSWEVEHDEYIVVFDLSSCIGCPILICRYFPGQRGARRAEHS